MPLLKSDYDKDDAIDQGASYHYQTIERAIGEIDKAEQPLSLEELSRRMHMSPAHFQRVFSQWVGVSPKRYQQYLTLEHAKSLLSERHSLLTTAHEAGLSGSGRLHDLFVTWEAMTPGEFAAAGDGLSIFWDWFDTPFGETLVMATQRGICGLAFASETGRDEAMGDMTSRWPMAEFVRDGQSVAPFVKAAISQTGSVKLHMIGAPFQIKVWEALMQIPSGHVTTYTDIAQAVGKPKAVRAVGTAVGRNPVSWLIPCHRALRKTGALGGYHWGLPVKRALLAWEAARADEDAA